MKPYIKRIFIALAFLALVSCSAHKAIKPDQNLDLINLSAFETFNFTGKMSFSDGFEGGSGQVEWNNTRNRVQVTMKAPLSKKSWTLIDTGDLARIHLSNGDVIQGVSASQLISEQVGWSIPWQPLQLWVIGQATLTGQVENGNAQGEYDIIDHGWKIEYTRIKTYGQGQLPHKIIARKGDYSIKLIIKAWQWSK